jgi:hypothetical protein
MTPVRRFIFFNIGCNYAPSGKTTDKSFEDRSSIRRDYGMRELHSLHRINKPAEQVASSPLQRHEANTTQIYSDRAWRTCKLHSASQKKPEFLFIFIFMLALKER